MDKRNVNGVGLLTFSLNNSLTNTKAKQVVALLNSMNDYNRDYAGDAFIEIMGGRTVLFLGDNAEKNLNTYAYYHKREDRSEIKKRAESEEPIISEVESDMGKSGAVAEMIEDREFNVEDITMVLSDQGYYMDQYLEVREFLFFKKGVDIHRLLTLAMQGDALAVRKAELLFRECNLIGFFREFFAVPAYWFFVHRLLNGKLLAK